MDVCVCSFYIDQDTYSTAIQIYYNPIQAENYYCIS